MVATGSPSLLSVSAPLNTQNTNQHKAKKKMQATGKEVQPVEQHRKRQRSTSECIPPHTDTMRSIQPTLSSTAEIGNRDEPHTLVALKRESQMAHPSCLFEKGSTSYSPNKYHNIPSDLIKGTAYQHRNNLRIDHLRTSYIPLKQVPGDANSVMQSSFNMNHPDFVIVTGRLKSPRINCLLS